MDFNFSGISNKSFVGKILRLPLRFIPKDLKLPIMQGRLRGKKWIVNSFNHGCWLGSYEYKQQKLFEEVVLPGSTVFDLGGHVGFYTLLASELVGPKGQVFVFEPLPRNLYFLHQHIKINDVNNVEIVEAAVSDKDGTARFSEKVSRTTGSLSQDGSVEVKTTTIDQLYLKGKIPLPNYMKIDIEGAEYLALKGAQKVIEKSYPTIFLSTHGLLVHNQCCRFLISLGYVLRSIDGGTIDETKEIVAEYKRISRQDERNVT